MSLDPREPADSKVHELFVQFVGARERGESPALVEYERRLESEPQRLELRKLVGALDELDLRLPAAIAPDQLIADRYRIRRQLGEGGMGRVWVAQDEKNERTVALKLVEVVGSQLETSALLRRERRALVRLRHPHIVTFHDADRWRDCCYLVMELVEGISIAEVLAGLKQRREAAGAGWQPEGSTLAEVIGRPLPPGRQDLVSGRSYFEAVAAIVARCASALECAHAANVVHRDLKPGNVLLTGGGNPVLLDFGLAALADATRSPLTSRLFGTPNYIAPEQARAGKMGVDPRTDIYQAGAILYELLTFARPWEDEPRDQIIQAIAEKELPRARSRVPAIPFELECICARALARDPEQRYPGAAELRRDLECYLGRKVLPAAARPQAPLGLRLRYFTRRHALFLAAATTLLLGAGAMLAFAGRGALPTESIDLDLQLGAGSAGVRIGAETRGKRVLYAMLFEHDAEGRLEAVAPLSLYRLGSSTESGASWSPRLELAAGVHEIETSELPRPSSAQQSLRVLSCPTPQEHFERAWRALHAEVRARGSAVPIARTHEILASSGVTPGSGDTRNDPARVDVEALLAPRPSANAFTLRLRLR
jgi:hypothetical protein